MRASMPVAIARAVDFLEVESSFSWFVSRSSSTSFSRVVSSRLSASAARSLSLATSREVMLRFPSGE